MLDEFVTVFVSWATLGPSSAALSIPATPQSATVKDDCFQTLNFRRNSCPHPNILCCTPASPGFEYDDSLCKMVSCSKIIHESPGSLVRPIPNQEGE